MAVEVAERQPAELGVDLGPEREHGPLGDPGHDVGLDPAEDRADDVDPDEDAEETAERTEVDAGGIEVEPAQHVGEPVVASPAELVDHLGLGRAAREDLLAEGAIDDPIDGVAEDPRPEDLEGHAHDREEDDDRDQPPFRGEGREQASERAPEVARLGRRHAHPETHHPGAAATAGSAGRATTRSEGRSTRTTGAGLEDRTAGSTAHATASASDSCE